MHFLGDVVAGCSPVDPECAAGTVPNGLDAWFLLVALLLLATAVVGAALLVRRRVANRRETATEPTVRA